MEHNENYLHPEQFEQLKMKELNFIDHHRCSPKQDNNKPRVLSGLSLSGGGIRSAIFNLGVLQALAKNGLLRKIDYLSTVSGGGYIGSSLTWFLSNKTQKDFSNHIPEANKGQHKHVVFGTDKHNFPYGTDEPGHFVTGEDSYIQRNLISYLRYRGNYLTPGENYTQLTLIAVALRTGMLSLMTWVPLISLIMLILINISDNAMTNTSPPYAFKLIGYASILSLLVFSVWGLIMAFIISLKTNRGHDTDSFKYRLLADKVSNALLNLTLIFSSIFLIAWLGTNLSTDTSGTDFNRVTYGISVFLMISTIFAGLITLINPDSQIINKFILPAASGLLAFSILLCAYQLAYVATMKLSFTVAGLTLYWNHLLYAGIAIALILCTRTNLNDISIARFYRDRLKETFMPNPESLRPGSQENFSKEVYLKDMCKSSEGTVYPGPYHLINANVVLVDSKQKQFNRRGGDNFILSPLYCGSKATGWRKTSNFFRGNLTLASAMAISGAAVNPHSGVAGQGLTRNRVVSFVLGILNFRLGAWAPNPNPDIKVWMRFYAGNFFQSAWYGIKSWTAHRGYHEKAACVQISDGGHFENLGVYELIRRELDFIIISDASADPEFTFADFRNALRLAEADLNVEISLDDNEKLSNIMPGEGNRIGQPMAEAQKGYLSGMIRYKNNKQGRFIYIKSTMTGGQRIRTKSYKLEYPRFPDQPTSDQFFDESQFAAYRDLGYTITCDMLENAKLSPLESRSGKERRITLERRNKDIHYEAENRRLQQRRVEIRRAA